MFVMGPLCGYFANLSRGRIVLWCYAIWYSVNVWNHFDPNPRLWLTSFGLSVIIGFALLLSITSSSKGKTTLDRWQVFRLFLMPFCVSSFAALVKDAAYVLVFPPNARENAAGLGAIGVFLVFIWLLRRTLRREES